MKAIYFDMDGTIADLYGFNGWLKMLQAEKTLPYFEAKPLVNVSEFNAILADLVKAGYVIGVISWGAMNCSNEYTREVKKAKRFWLCQFFPALANGEYHVVKYGTPKHKVRKIQDSILVDDNKEVREAWQGETIDASNTAHMVEALRALAKVA